ncbi:uncharacterized protein V6R79_024963 [Siganus canaliculatus]
MCVHCQEENGSAAYHQRHPGPRGSCPRQGDQRRRFRTALMKRKESGASQTDAAAVSQEEETLLVQADKREGKLQAERRWGRLTRQNNDQRLFLRADEQTSRLERDWIRVSPQVRAEHQRPCSSG